MGRTLWRGVWLDDRTAAMMDEVANLVGPGIYVRPTQGSWSYAGTSANTHSGCGAIDIVDTMDNLKIIEREMRRVGFFASVRPELWSNGERIWPDHVHGIAVQAGGKWDEGCLAGSAHDQIVDYYEGRNGLANNGPDRGPRQFVGVTWEKYKEDPVITQADVDRIAEATAKLVVKPTARLAARRVWLWKPPRRPDMFNTHRLLRGVYGTALSVDEYLDEIEDDTDFEDPPDNT